MRNRFWINIAALICLGMPSTAMAQDVTYAPNGCEFAVDYPEAPSAAQACNADNPDQCYEVARFNRVYSLDSALKITSTCNPAEPGMLERYSGEVMTFTLGTVAKGRADKPETSFADYGFAKQAILLGGRTLQDGTESVFIAHLWIGKKSVLTIEGEVTGIENPEADQLLTKIMQSVRHVGPEKAPAKNNSSD